MATPLLDHEVLRLDNSSYVELLVTTFQHLQAINATNYSDLFKQSNTSVHIENASKDKVQFKFRSDTILSCSGNFSFKQDKLNSFTYTIKPVSYFKKRVCKKQYQRIITMLTNISKTDGAEVKAISNEVTRFHFDSGTLTVTNGQHIITGTPMVTILFDR